MTIKTNFLVIMGSHLFPYFNGFFCVFHLGGAPPIGSGRPLSHVPVFSLGAAGAGTAPLTMLSTGAAGGSGLSLVTTTPSSEATGGIPCVGIPSLSRLPRRLQDKIKKLEFVEMSDLLPAAWSAAEAQDASGASSTLLPNRRSPVSDIGVWVECYSLMASVLVESHPEKATHLFAYLRRVSRAARNFQGSAWVAYDRIYRRQALARGSLDWGLEDPSLYSEAFVGRAKVVPRCSHCLSEFHAVDACPDFPRVVSYSCTPFHSQTVGVSPQVNHTSFANEICKRFNEGRCTFKRCRYRHVCLGCKKYGHPQLKCPEKQSSSRVRSPREA